MRESWDGLLKVRAKESGEIDVRPHGATDLASELFAMFDDNIPQTQNAPVTLNQQPNTTPLTINNPSGGNGIVLNDGGLTLKKGNLTMDGGVATLSGDTPLVVNGSIDVQGGFYLQNGVPLKTEAVATIYLGKVVSGTGDTYQVELYGNGSRKAKTATVQATVPQIDTNEQIPAGTWIAAVHKFTNVQDGRTVVTYEFQPPVWL